ncbi:hypothetical protein BDR06DRAFT_1005409 [Suillus hirtellus]|nr:hypothetical protein BDR06DRAFT_1005409 [Suillus hirtellus]
MDYCKIPTTPFKKACHAFTSIEMLEHVASKHYHGHFKPVDFALNSSNATAVRSLPLQALVSEGRFMLEGVVNRAALRVDYPRTLREWGHRLDANVRQDLIVEDYPSLENKAESDTFQRK